MYNMDGGIKVNTVQLADLIYCCNNEWRQVVERIAKQHKLTVSEWRCLSCIVREKMMEQQVLARELNIAPNNIGSIADSLVKKGFIAKSIKATDKKIRVLKISNKKAKLAVEISKLNDQLCRSWFSGLTKKEGSALEELLSNALGSIQAINDKF
jgi:DNA-binding MarR family transcriptional regulator